MSGVPKRHQPDWVPTCLGRFDGAEGLVERLQSAWAARGAAAAPAGAACIATYGFARAVFDRFFGRSGLPGAGRGLAMTGGFTGTLTDGFGTALLDVDAAARDRPTADLSSLQPAGAHTR